MIAVSHENIPRRVRRGIRLGALLAPCLLAMPSLASAQPAPSSQRVDPERAPTHVRPQYIPSDPPPPTSPGTYTALRILLASTSIAISVGAIVNSALLYGHPRGDDLDLRGTLWSVGVKYGGFVNVIRLFPQGRFPPSGIASVLEGLAAPLAFVTYGVAFGGLSDRSRDLWVGALVAASAYNTLNLPTVWFRLANDPVALWASAGVGLATAVGGGLLAVTEPDETTATAIWVLTGLSAAATIHQTVWAIVGRASAPEVAPQPERPRLALVPAPIGRGMGVSLAGAW